MTSNHLIIMAAGTGGHIIPGLAVAKEMQTRGWTISWLGTKQGMENKLVPPTGIAMDTIAFSGLRGKGAMHTITGALKLITAFWHTLQFIRQRKATAVLGMGGYVCFPGGLMAALLRKPLMLVNADAALLMSNKSLLPFADKIAFGFDGEAAHKVKRSVVTGNPVRSEIENLATPTERFAGRSGPLKLLVVGGSLGAKVLNEVVPQALAFLQSEWRVERERHPQVTHQTGEANFESVRAAYAKAEVSAEVLPFIDNMAERLATCDLIICRAGAVTVSELCAAGVASVLVPLMVSTTSHQRDNAQWLAGQGAGIHLPQAELTPQRLAHLLKSLTREALWDMATKARALAKPKAAARVADELERLVAAA